MATFIMLGKDNCSEQDPAISFEGLRELCAAS